MVSNGAVRPAIASAKVAPAPAVKTATAIPPKA
jgi:hypothetical protein